MRQARGPKNQTECQRREIGFAISEPGTMILAPALWDSIALPNKASRDQPNCERVRNSKTIPPPSRRQALIKSAPGRCGHATEGDVNHHENAHCYHGHVVFQTEQQLDQLTSTHHHLDDQVKQTTVNDPTAAKVRMRFWSRRYEAISAR